MDIVSAKPSTEEQDGIVHHLIDILTPDIDFSAGDFVKHSEEIINKTDKPIIICGGTWFYIKSLLDEVRLPKCEINNTLRKELENLDNDTLWKKLAQMDIERAKEIHPNNKDKIIRSIELCTFLKMPVSKYKREVNVEYDAQWYMKEFNREALYSAINERVDSMVEQGLYEEWKNNNNKYGKTNIMYNTIGYKEFYELQDKIYDNIEAAIEKIKQHTRNFAKRQLTYYKSNPKIKIIKSADQIIEDL